MKTIIRLDVTERKALLKRVRSSDGPTVLHAMIVLLLELFSPSWVAKTLGLSRSGCFDRAKRWRTSGLSSLGHRPRSGRPAKLTPATLERAEHLLERSPRDVGYPTNVWTLRLLQDYLRRTRRRQVSTSTLRRQLLKRNWRLKRPRKGPAHSADPLGPQKLARLAQVKANLAPTDHLVYVDEAGFSLLGTVRRIWARRGSQPVYPTPGKNKTLYAYGSYEPGSKRFHYHLSPHLRATEFVAFLEQVLKQYTGKVYVVLDNASIHGTKAVEAFAEAQRDRLELLWIPTHSPQYNEPIERVWDTTKTWINGNASARDLYELQRRVRKGLMRFQQLALRREKKTGSATNTIVSKDFCMVS